MYNVYTIYCDTLYSMCLKCYTLFNHTESNPVKQFNLCQTSVCVSSKGPFAKKGIITSSEKSIATVSLGVAGVCKTMTTVNAAVLLTSKYSSRSIAVLSSGQHCPDFT